MSSNAASRYWVLGNIVLVNVVVTGAAWNYVVMFVPDVVAPAEIPVSMNAFKTQQHRWSKGSIQTARGHSRRIWNGDPLGGRNHGAERRDSEGGRAPLRTASAEQDGAQRSLAKSVQIRPAYTLF